MIQAMIQATARWSRLQQEATARSWLTHVPAPTLLPAASGTLPPQPYQATDGSSFQFNNLQADANGAEMGCQKQCGHLASYSSLSQQAEVEAYYEAAVSGCGTAAQLP
jgi:hypothetical protein